MSFLLLTDASRLTLATGTGSLKLQIIELEPHAMHALSVLPTVTMQGAVSMPVPVTRLDAAIVQALPRGAAIVQVQSMPAHSVLVLSQQVAGGRVVGESLVSLLEAASSRFAAAGAWSAVPVDSHTVLAVSTTNAGGTSVLAALDSSAVLAMPSATGAGLISLVPLDSQASVTVVAVSVGASLQVTSMVVLVTRPAPVVVAGTILLAFAAFVESSMPGAVLAASASLQAPSLSAMSAVTAEILVGSAVVVTASFVSESWFTNTMLSGAFLGAFPVVPTRVESTMPAVTLVASVSLQAAASLAVESIAGLQIETRFGASWSMATASLGTVQPAISTVVGASLEVTILQALSGTVSSSAIVAGSVLGVVPVNSQYVLTSSSTAAGTTFIVHALAELLDVVPSSITAGASFTAHSQQVTSDTVLPVYVSYTIVGVDGDVELFALVSGITFVAAIAEGMLSITYSYGGTVHVTSLEDEVCSGPLVDGEVIVTRQEDYVDSYPAILGTIETMPL